jgi:hypothetical protein
MELTIEQKKKVEQWVAEGGGLSDIQKRLSSELGINMTYMDVRFLVLDLGLKVKDKAQASKPPQPASELNGGLQTAIDDKAPQQSAAGVTVDVDRVMKPGSLVSGTVKFSDGVTASWMIDELGRLGLSASKRGYTPPTKDLQAFQMELKKVLEKQGF